MKTQMVDRTKEKAELAEAIGLQVYANILNNKVRNIAEQKQAVKELAFMKFKPISKQEITKKLPRVYFEREVTPLVFLWFVTVIAAIPIVVGIFNPGAIGVASNWVCGTIAFVSGVLGFLGICEPCKTVVRNNGIRLYISKFNDVPYGCLLAVKEAQEAGITNFSVYYATKQIDVKMNGDPVCTGIYKGVEVEVFSWDDGKIREA